MKTMKWLLRRELWEHKGMFVWAPLVVGALMILLLSVSATKFGTHFDGMGATPEQQQAAASQMLAAVYMANSAPMLLMLGVVAFFYCMGALADDRKDRSILFWKSLPISDRATVLSKVATALLVAPLISIGVAIVTSLVLVIILSIKLALQGFPVLGSLLAQRELYLSPFEVLGMLPVYILWALPTVGWLLMVSSWARSKVFLWAVGVPVLVIVFLKWFEFMAGTGWDINAFIKNVIGRGLLGLIPGSWVFFSNVDPAAMVSPAADSHHLSLTSVFGTAWDTLRGPGVWIGALAGAAMITVAIRMRSLRDEG